MEYTGRTDLACEAHEQYRLSERAAELPGVAVRQETLEGLPVTAVVLSSEESAARLGKKPGRYYTLDLPARFERGAEDFPRIAVAIAALIRRCLRDQPPKLSLIAALGNPDITPDALGSLAAADILVTRHLKTQVPSEFSAFSGTALCRTGVLGTTGIESAVQIRMLCRELRPDCVLAIDALAGASVSRLCRTVQISDTGIAPGSGVGNDREALDFNTLGVPVIAIGMPTVIDAALLSSDPALTSLFVTPRGIDSAVRCGGRLIAYGINLALHPTLQLADLDMLLG